MKTAIKYSEDIIPISDLKVNPGRVVTQVDKTHRPVLLTSRGRGVAIVQSLKDYEADADERVFLRREIIYPPFRLVYRLDGKRARVVRVWRAERVLKLS